MVKDADVVVIGSGGFGAATAYFLMRRGGRRVALLDRHALASQTSPRAAGNAAMLRSTDLMSRLARPRRGVAPPAHRRHGRAPRDRPVGEPEGGADGGGRGDPRARGRPGRAARPRNPARLAGGRASHAPVLPAPRRASRPPYAGRRLLRALPRRHRLRDRRGQAGRDAPAEHHGHRRPRRATARWKGVETDRGRIESPVVVDAAGAWARQVAAAAGIHVPMVPTRHQVLITEPIEGGDARSCRSCGSWTPRSTCAPAGAASSRAATRRSRPSSRWSGFRRASRSRTRRSTSACCAV